VGGCGLEVAELNAYGLAAKPGDADVRARAVLSGTLFVESRFRRHGIAQRLLREAETQARWWGCGELLLLVKAGNKPARRLYEKMGFVTHSEGLLHGSDICMSRKLFMPNLHTVLSIAPQYHRVSDGSKGSARGKHGGNSYLY
jgi:hypothetical protein